MRIALSVLLLIGGYFLLDASLLGQQPDCALTLEGKLVRGDEAQPVAYARVQLVELDTNTLTDSAGHFTFSGLCAGTYTLSCSHPFGSDTAHHCHLDHSSPPVEISISKSDYELDEVTIQAAALPRQSTQTAVRVEQTLTQGQLHNLGEALTAVSGVSVLKTGATIAKPVIHGLHSNRVLILNNGIRLEGQQWGSEHAPEIDPFVAKNLTVLKGAAAVRYGSGAMAGVILVEPAALPDSAGVHGNFTSAGHTNGRVGIVSGSLEGALASLPGWAWRVQGTYKRGGNLRTPDYFLANTGVRERNFSATMGYQSLEKGLEVYYSQFNTQLGILKAAHVGSRSDLEAAIQADRPRGADAATFSYEIGRPFQSVVHHLAKIKAFHRVGERGKLNVTYALQHNRRSEFDTHGPIGSTLSDNIPQLDFRINTHTLEGTFTHRPGRRWHSSWGAFAMYQNNVLRGQPFIPNFVSISGEAFGIERWRVPGNRLVLEAGARYDYRYLHSARRESAEVVYEVRQFHNVSGTLGAIYTINSDLELSVNLGSSWRPPHVNELFSDGLHHGAATVVKGNPDLEAEQAIKGIATLDYASFDGFYGSLSLYYHHFFNFIYQRPDGIDRTIRGTFPRLQYMQTPALLQGADLQFGYRWERGVILSAKAAWLKADNLATDQPLIFMPANWAEGTAAYQLPASVSRARPKMSFSVRHVARQDRVPVEVEPQANDWLPPPPSYTLVNLSLEASPQLGPHAFKLGVRAENLLNLRYRDYLDRFRYFADAPGRNISFWVKFQF